MSQAAVEGILKNVAERGLPSASNRRAQRNARHLIANEENPYGSCIVETVLPTHGYDGSSTIAVGNPFAMLYRLDAECSEFHDSINALYAKKPCTPDDPWHLIFYFDAVSPSNPLNKGKDRRDTQCLYWTILELQRCSQEEYWLTSAACRAFLIDDHLPGKMSHFFKIILHTFFGDVENFAVTGCRLQRGARIFLKHQTTLADFKAHAEVLHSFGQSGTKPCPICRSIIVHNRGEMHLRGPGITPYTTTNPTDIHEGRWSQWARVPTVGAYMRPWRSRATYYAHRASREGMAYAR